MPPDPEAHATEDRRRGAEGADDGDAEGSSADVAGRISSGGGSGPARRVRWPRAVMHLDMDAFFASVHVLAHPEDSGRPIAVGGRPDQRGVVASASYEARAYGVRSAMPMRTAVRLCPDLLIVDHDWALIQSCSRAVMEILADYGTVEPMSVDEAYVDLTTHEDPPSVARMAQRRVREDVRLPSSVGLATSKLVAKVASDRDKPEGCTIVPPGAEARFLADLPVRALHGVGPKTQERLAAVGIATCADLAAADIDSLAAAVGNSAEALQHMSVGRDPRRVSAARTPNRSVSSERTFLRDERDPRVLVKTLDRLAEGIARRLARRGYAGRTVAVKFRWSDFTTFTRQTTLSEPTDSAVEIGRAARHLLRTHWKRGRRVRLLGVSVSNLTRSPERQLRLDL